MQKLYKQYTIPIHHIHRSCMLLHFLCYSLCLSCRGESQQCYMYLKKRPGSQQSFPYSKQCGHRLRPFSANSTTYKTKFRCKKSLIRSNENDNQQHMKQCKVIPTLSSQQQKQNWYRTTIYIIQNRALACSYGIPNRSSYLNLTVEPRILT